MGLEEKESDIRMCHKSDHVIKTSPSYSHFYLNEQVKAKVAQQKSIMKWRWYIQDWSQVELGNANKLLPQLKPMSILDYIMINGGEKRWSLLNGSVDHFGM